MIIKNISMFVLFLLSHSLNGYGQRTEVFEILENDTSVYELVDLITGSVVAPDSIIKSDYGTIIDGMPLYEWRRKSTAADGQYIMYYLRDPIHYRYQSADESDTVCYVVRNYLKGLVDGEVNSYYYHGNKLMQTEQYDNGKLLEKISYYRYPKGGLEGSSYWPLAYNNYRFLLDSSDILITTTKYFTNSGIEKEEQALIRNLDTFTVYTYSTDFGMTELHQVHYFLNKPQSMALKYIIKNGVGIEKHWCQDGTLYYHLRRKVTISRNRPWYEGKETIIVNKMNGGNAKWGRWFRYECN